MFSFVSFVFRSCFVIMGIVCVGIVGIVGIVCCFILDECSIFSCKAYGSV